MKTYDSNLIPGVFSDDRYYIRPKELFYFLFGELCSIYAYHDYKAENILFEKIIEHYSKNEYFQKLVDEDVFSQESKANSVNTYFVIDKYLILWICNEGISIYYKEGANNEEFGKLRDLVASLISKADKDNLPVFYVIFDEYGLVLRQFKTLVLNIDIKTHYNDSFLPVNEKIFTFLNDIGSGLVLLHGNPGTGKTTYIRYIINHLKKKIIYLPSNLVINLTKPSFLPFMADYPDSIFVIEDCEELLMQRSSSDETNSALVNLLNMSDGLIGDGFRFKFLCIFNSPIINIDKALLRKGRLMAKYEFKELEPEKANKLIESEGLKMPKVTKPVTLADLYHYDSSSNEPDIKKIGFI